MSSKKDKPFKNVIWEGRFQPIHKGHLAYIEKLLSYGEHVWIYMVHNEVSSNAAGFISLVPEFTSEVDKHHIAAKNPWPFHIRYRLTNETLKYEFGENAPITFWGGRRMDLIWPFCKEALPDNRVFLTPERDEFEDCKARAWTQLGERVVRIDVSDLPKISATDVRNAITNQQPTDELLSPMTLKLMKEFDALEMI